MFGKRCMNVLNELSLHNRSREELLSECIEARLKQSLQSYYSEISSSEAYLKRRDELNLMKKMNK